MKGAWRTALLAAIVLLLQWGGGWGGGPLALPLGAQASTTDGYVMVTLTARAGWEGEAIAAIEAQGGRVTARYGDLIDALVPEAALSSLAAEPWVLRLQRSLPLWPGDVLTEALRAQQVALPPALKEAGTGVKVGIIDSFAGFHLLLGKELPPPERVVYRSFTANPGATAHGTAVAEIVYDLAPKATLYLAEATTMAEVAQAVDWLIAQGVHIINMSLNAPFAPPSHGTGFDALTVEKAAAHGVLWVNSAGNYGNKHWRGPWHDPDADLVLDFAGGREAAVMQVPRETSFIVVLRWDNPWPGACDDYDLMVSWVDPRAGPRQLVSSASQDCGPSSQPLEMVSGQAQTVDGRLNISVRRRPTARPVTLELFVLGGVLEGAVPEGSVTPPADSPKAVAVGAAPYYDLRAIHPYSSRGPGALGSIKPDFVGPDTVSTATLGSNAFAGTSASAAHITGLAAILKGLRPDWGPDQIREALRQWAEDAGPPGPDIVFGYGAIDLMRVMEKLLRPPPPPISTAVFPYDDGRVLVTWQGVAGATHYLFCLDLRADFSSPFASCREVGGGTTSFLAPVPQVDAIPYYFRVRACNAAGCSEPVSAGGVVRRVAGGLNGWHYYFTAYNQDGMTVAAVRNLRPAPATVRLYRGLVGAYPWFSLQVECRDLPPGGVCQGRWPANWIASAVQSLAPWWDLATALILLP